jgi:hypothetical protein
MSSQNTTGYTRIRCLGGVNVFTKQTTGYTRIRCLGGVNILTKTDYWLYQKQLLGRRKCTCNGTEVHGNIRVSFINLFKMQSRIP